LVNGLAPTGISPYTELAAGDHQVKIGLTGSGGTLLQRQITLDEGKDYSFLVSGSLASPEGMLASDTAGIPLPGKVKIRIVHAARNAPPLDVYLTAPGADLSGQGTVVEPFEFGVDTANFPGFVERDPGDYEVRFTQDGTTNVVLGTGTFHAAAGQVLTEDGRRRWRQRRRLGSGRHPHPHQWAVPQKPAQIRQAGPAPRSDRAAAAPPAPEPYEPPAPR
ncbi:MAG TPA: DUF4397 domain-containing protein, partial [Gemmatimonadaceae bacterium]